MRHDVGCNSSTYGSSGFTRCSLRAQEYVILVHGLRRSTWSMNQVERALLQAGYPVSNVALTY
jgi:hypothetical protein